MLPLGQLLGGSVLLTTGPVLVVTTEYFSLPLLTLFALAVGGVIVLGSFTITRLIRFWWLR